MNYDENNMTGNCKMTTKIQMTEDQLRDSVKSKIKTGMRLSQNGRLLGTVVEVEKWGTVAYKLQKPSFSTSEMREDSGIAAGTKMTEGIIDLIGIATGEIVCGDILPTADVNHFAIEK